MTQHAIDLTNLHEMTDNDRELEQSLFAEFLLSGARCIEVMQASITAGDAPAFKSHAHAFKGTALNLGANALGEWCKKAQDSYEANAEEKTRLLSEIKKSFEEVRAFLATQ